MPVEAYTGLSIIIPFVCVCACVHVGWSHPYLFVWGDETISSFCFFSSSVVRHYKLSVPFGAHSLCFVLFCSQSIRFDWLLYTFVFMIRTLFLDFLYFLIQRLKASSNKFGILTSWLSGTPQTQSTDDQWINWCPAMNQRISLLIFIHSFFTIKKE